MDFKITLLCIMAFLLLTSAHMVHADPYDPYWFVQLGDGSTNGIYMGTRVGAHDGFVFNEDSELSTVPTIGTVLYTTDFDGHDTFADVRAPMEAGQTKTWHILAQVFGSAGTIRGWNASTRDLDTDALFTVTLYSVPVFGGTRTSVWPVDPSVNGDLYDHPNWQTTLATGTYYFELEALAPLPEPSSILALLCGIGGFGGLILRKRSA